MALGKINTFRNEEPAGTVCTLQGDDQVFI
jgi:hypothetical protein